MTLMDHSFMDHSYIEANQVVDRYLMKQLPQDEAARFEDHYFSCQECLDQLELAEQWQRGIKRAVVEDVAAVQQIGRLAWRSRMNPAVRAGLVALLLVAAVLPFGLVVQELRRTESRLQDALAPQVGTALVSISPTRGLPSGDDAPTHVIRFQSDAQRVLVSLHVGDREFDAYRVTLEHLTLDKQSLEVWSQDGVKPDPQDALNLSLHASWLEPGDYVARVEARSAAGETVPVARFPFRVLRDD